MQQTSERQDASKPRERQARAHRRWFLQTEGIASFHRGGQAEVSQTPPRTPKAASVLKPPCASRNAARRSRMAPSSRTMNGWGFRPGLRESSTPDQIGRLASLSFALGLARSEYTGGREGKWMLTSWCPWPRCSWHRSSSLLPPRSRRALRQTPCSLQSPWFAGFCWGLLDVGGTTEI